MTGLEELDEADIEDAIRRELEALDHLDLTNFEGFSEAKYESTQTQTFEKELSSEEKYGIPPDSVKTFITLLQCRNDKLQEELAEAEDAVRLASKHKDVTAAIGNEVDGDGVKLSPEVKEKVLHEIEDLEQSDIIAENKDGDGEDISSLEEMALKNLKELEVKQDERSCQLNSLFSAIKEEEILRHEKEEKMRAENKQKANEEHKIKMNENESVKIKLEEEATHQRQKLQDLQKQFELDMKNLEKIRAEEKLALERMKSEERRKHEAKKELASITIQKNFRMYRVQSKYDQTLKVKREKRQKQRQEELDALEQKEKRLMEEAIQKEKEDELKRKEEIERDKMRKEEAERKRIEEEELRKKLEMEKKQEEERRLEMERKERQEELERKMAEERKRKEEEEEQKRIEGERKKKELEEKKLEEKRKLEQKRLEEERKMKEQKELERKRLEKQRKLEEQKELQRKKLEEQKELERKKLEEKELERKRTQDERNERKENNNVWFRDDEQTQVPKVNKVTSNGNTYCSDAPHGSSDDLHLVWESCREKWLKQTTLWSAFSVVEDTNARSRSKPRRPLSASQKLSSISEEEILKSQKLHTSLDKVVCINVKDLPPRNLKILSKCPNVKSVTVQKCSLLSAESFGNCRHLLELNLSDNSIQHVSCQNLDSLVYLDLRNNQLTSIHGLDGCHNLRSLYLDGNKITRIGTLQSNKVLHLSLQDNQLITTKGLSTWKYLQVLDCSNNHLSKIQELDSCPLLRVLKLRGNNLRKPPDLSNHVLLRELHLGENSIPSLEGLSNQWLPLLQHLYVNNNSLSSVCSLRNFPMLETLDVKNNLISDEENLLPGLSGCHQLQKLAIQANPVCEDSTIRSGIAKTLPKLKVLDGEKMETALNTDNSDLKTIFYPICRAQIAAQDDLLRRQNAEKENCQGKSDDDEDVKRLTLQSRHFQELLDLIIKHRLQHETFKKPEANQRDRISNSSIPDQSSKHLKQESSELTSPNKDSEQSDTARSVSGGKDASDSTFNNPPHPGVMMANLSKTGGNGPWKQKHHEAATLIQARFRGHRIRKRYLEATRSAQYSHSDLETDDFNFDEEVDLDMFDIDEAALDTGWVPTNFPQTPRNTVVPDDLSPKQQQTDNEEVERDVKLPFPRKHAWRSPDSPLSSPNPRKVIPPIEAPSVLSEQTSPPGETHRSHRTSELSSEWGFSKNSTAELMMKRANKMKYNALRKKKMTDPERRFQLFKKADESNKARGVQTVQKRKEKPRVDYFSGRHYGDGKITEKQEEESQAKKEMTFSWVYDQAVLHKDQGEDILRDTREYYTESKPTKNRPDRSPPGVSLPRMDPVVLAGRNLPLVATPVSNPRTPSIYSGDVEIGSRRKYSWQQTKTHSNPDLTRVGFDKESRSAKSNSAEARIIKERNHIL